MSEGISNVQQGMSNVQISAALGISCFPMAKGQCEWSCPASPWKLDIPCWTLPACRQAGIFPRVKSLPIFRHFPSIFFKKQQNPLFRGEENPRFGGLPEGVWGGHLCIIKNDKTSITKIFKHNETDQIFHPENIHFYENFRCAAHAVLF